MTTDKANEIDLDDPRFRIRPYQQMIASCTGALITSIFGKTFQFPSGQVILL